MSCTECISSSKICRYSAPGKKPESLSLACTSRTAEHLLMRYPSLCAFLDEFSCTILRSHFSHATFMLCIQYPCKYFLLRQYPRAIFAMKCSAAEAGFPVEGQTIRVLICVPADRCTRNEPMTLSLVYHNSDNIDIVKKILAYRIREIAG